MMNNEPENRLEGGLRTRDDCSRFDSHMPLVTVVTVVLNGRDCLEETILSVITQTYENVEYIVIDGGSTDGTLDIVRRYDNCIDYWLSEPDKGIYDAMNKGAELASGEWINFMNAGDRFHANNLVSVFFARECSQYDLIYGNEEVCYGGRFSRILKSGSDAELWKGMNFSHQCVFMRTSLVVSTGFNVGNSIGADFELVYRLKTDGCNFLKLDETVAITQAGGLSDVKRVQAFISYWRVVSAYGGSIKVTLYYLWKILDSVVRIAVAGILPQGIIDKIIKLKR